MAYGQRSAGSPYGVEPSRLNGWIGFAGVFLLIVGLMKVIYGLALIFQDEKAFFTSGGVVFGSLTSAGWMMLIVGVLMVAAGGGLLSGGDKPWARVLALVFAVVGFIEAFFTFPIYPLWNIIVMIVLGFVVYALTTQARATD